MRFSSDDKSLQRLWDRALAGLADNCRPVFGSGEKTVLNEGGIYTGIWLECGPQEALTYASVNPEVTRLSHEIFYRHQRPDGQFPAYILADRAGYGQIQQVMPIVRTAWTFAQLSGDEAFLERSYRAAAGWDGWLAKYRDSRNLGVVEAFCEYDTGHDNSSRWHGVPKDCPGAEARNRPDLPGLPRIAPDLSATLYGGRLALAEMAAALGKTHEAEQWREQAEITRAAIRKYCFDPVLEFFFDRDCDGQWIRIIGDAGLRVMGEGVPSQAEAERIFARYILNPDYFWTPYPLPSIAAADPAFIPSAPENCWGGATQALAALRAPRWFERYGYFEELDEMMSRWLEALGRASEFMQQMEPFTGVFSTSPGYSPAMCVTVDFIARRHGILETPEGIWWGCVEPSAPSRFELELMTGGSAEIRHADGESILSLKGKEILRTNRPERVFSTFDGRIINRLAVNQRHDEVVGAVDGDSQAVVVQ